MMKLNKIARCVGTALALSYAATSPAAITAPGALGDAFMHFTNFQFAIGDGALTPGGGAVPIGALVAGGALSISTTGFETATTQAVMNGALGATVGNGSYALGTGFIASSTIGAGFAPLGPLVPVTGSPVAVLSGAGGYSSSSGDSTIGTAEVYLHSISQLNSTGSTNSSATQDVQTTFTVNVNSAALIELSFDLTRFIRAGLGQENLKALAQTQFSVTVTKDSGSTLVYSWTPNGNPFFAPLGTHLDLSGTCFINTVLGADMAGAPLVDSCKTYADPFSMQSGVTQNGGVGDQTPGLQGGYFESELYLPIGVYAFTIASSVTSNASIVPEPGSIALLGLGLLGLGLVSRRKFVAA